MMEDVWMWIIRVQTNTHEGGGHKKKKTKKKEKKKKTQNSINMVCEVNLLTRRALL